MVDIVIDDYVKKMTNSLETLTIDLNEKKEELNSKKDYCERVSRFLAYASGDINLVGIYADQELIYENLEHIGQTKEAYKASCYLLRSNDDSVKSLPQYREASEFILSLINHFKMMKSDLLSEIQSLEKECHQKEIEKKYYDMFKSENMLVDDVIEYREFLDNHASNNDEKISLLVYAINCNVNYYNGKRS